MQKPTEIVAKIKDETDKRYIDKILIRFSAQISISEIYRFYNFLMRNEVNYFLIGFYAF